MTHVTPWWHSPVIPEARADSLASLPSCPLVRKEKTLCDVVEIDGKKVRKCKKLVGVFRLCTDSQQQNHLETVSVHIDEREEIEDSTQNQSHAPVSQTQQVLGAQAGQLMEEVFKLVSEMEKNLAANGTISAIEDLPQLAKPSQGGILSRWLGWPKVSTGSKQGQPLSQGQQHSSLGLDNFPMQSI